MGAIGKVSVQPCGLLAQGHSTRRAIFPVPYFVYLKVVLCSLNVSEFVLVAAAKVVSIATYLDGW
jgi:hypothetical protein